MDALLLEACQPIVHRLVLVDRRFHLVVEDRPQPSIHAAKVALVEQRLRVRLEDSVGQKHRVGQHFKRRIVVHSRAVRDLSIERNPAAVVTVIPQHRFAPRLSGAAPHRTAHRPPTASYRGEAFRDAGCKAERRGHVCDYLFTKALKRQPTPADFRTAISHENL